MNKIAPLSTRQHKYLLKTFNSWLNVAEGGKRGGKNVLNALAFALNLEEHPDKLHLIAGVNVAAAKINVIDCDGYGLANYFEGRCREGEYKKRDALFIKTRTGEKIVLVSGLGKDGEEKKIKGNTYGMVYITEVNECHPKGIQECFDRTLSSKDRKIFHDLNPKAEGHFYYSDILNFHEEKQKANPEYGLNYGHFTIADNMSLTQQHINRELDKYDKKSVWYLRDILGQRKQAEGIIYRQFADNKKNYILDESPENIAFSQIGVDFGGNESAQAFVCTGFSPDLKTIVTLDEYYTKEKITPKELEENFIAFVRRNAKYRPTTAFCDNAEQVLINGIRYASIKAGLSISIENARKGPIVDRIRFYNSLFNREAYKIMSHCTNLIGAFENALWNPKSLEDKRLDDGTTNIDSLDAQEYSTENLQRQIQQLLIVGGDKNNNTGLFKKDRIFNS